MSRKGEKEEAKCGANHPTSLRYAVAGREHRDSREKKIIVDRRATNEDRGEKNKPRKTRKARK